MLRLSADAPGKLIILGEYAVLEGAPALVGAVARRARADIARSDNGYALHTPILSEGMTPFTIEDNGRIRFPERLPESDHRRLGVFRACMEEAIRVLRTNGGLPPMAIRLDTGDFFLDRRVYKLGLGSSAALTVSLMAGMYAFTGRMDSRIPDRKTLLERALKAHRQAQSNTGSGVDVAASVYGGVFEYRRGTDPDSPTASMTPTNLPSELVTIAVWTGHSASTPELVSRVNRFKEQEPVRYQRVMGTLMALSAAGIEALKENDSQSFLDIVSRYGDEMERLGNWSDTPILSAEHREIRDICAQYNVVYKPSGAGGGDLGILFAPSGAALGDLLARLEGAGYPVFDLQIGTHGVRTRVEPEEPPERTDS